MKHEKERHEKNRQYVFGKCRRPAFCMDYVKLGRRMPAQSDRLLLCVLELIQIVVLKTKKKHPSAGKQERMHRAA